MSLSLTLNRFHTFFGVLIVDFEQYFLLVTNTFISEHFCIQYVLHIFEYLNGLIRVPTNHKN